MKNIGNDAIIGLLEEILEKVDKRLEEKVELDNNDSTFKKDEAEVYWKQKTDELFRCIQSNNISQETLHSVMFKLNRKLSDYFNSTKTISEYQKSQDEILTYLDEIKENKQPQKVVHSFDLRNSKMLLFISGLIAIVIICVLVSVNYISENKRLKENDLKYRYIKATHLKHNSNPELILHLDNAFKYPKNKKEINYIKKYVNDFEKKQSILNNQKNESIKEK